jgi:hypothetical protein
VTLSTVFDQGKHAGYVMWMNSSCTNGTTINETVLLKPCGEPSWKNVLVNKFVFSMQHPHFDVTKCKSVVYNQIYWGHFSTMTTLYGSRLTVFLFQSLYSYSYMHLMLTFLSMFRIYMYHFVLGREFTAHARYNATHVTISCQYSSFRLSTDGTHIDNGNVTLATCRWDSAS